MITRQTVVVGQSRPDLTLAQFEAILEAGGSPALREVGECYEAVVRVGVSVAFAAAIFWEESNFGTTGYAVQNCNPGNTRSTTTGIGEVVPTEKGPFVRYPGWAEGFRDMAWRLVKPDYFYAGEGRKTIEQIIERWAPASDGNRTEGYILDVVKVMNGWIGSGGGGILKDPTTRVRLIPGHAGRGGTRKKIITLHIQVGYNDLYAEFLNRPASNQADCHIWSKRDGTLDRFLYDADTPWTNGDVVGPDMTNSIIAGMVVAGVTNTNPYSYTIEHQGFDYEQFPDGQIEATAQMCAFWMSKEGWGPEQVGSRIVGHFQVGNHKGCPGPNFPWGKLRARVQEILGVNGMNVDDAGGAKAPVPGTGGFEPNPLGKDVGPGVLEVLRKEGMTALTNEDYYVPEGGKAGLTKRSFTYCRDGAGVTYRVEAIQDQDGAGQVLPTWTRQVWQFLREYK